MHNNIGAAEYNWSCTDSDDIDEGYRYIPNILRDEDALHVSTEGDELHIYHLSDELRASCYGRVIAIEYCYQFNDTTVPAAFNWTVLLLEESSSDHSEDFKIRDIITIENCEPDVISYRPGQPLCCDMIDIESFDLSQNFIFGVTESFQGNTAGATLLGFSDSLPQYQVDVVLINRAEVTLSVGSIVPTRNRPTTKRGIRMLWFVIGKLTFTISSVMIYNIPISS